jgi:hypothetical protein
VPSLLAFMLWVCLFLQFLCVSHISKVFFGHPDWAQTTLCLGFCGIVCYFVDHVTLFHLQNHSFMLLKPTSHLFLKFFLTYLAVLCCFFEDQGIGSYELCLVATPASILSCSCVWNVNWGLLFVPLASDVFLTGKTIDILHRLEHQWKLSFVFAAVSNHNELALG